MREKLESDRLHNLAETLSPVLTDGTRQMVDFLLGRTHVGTSTLAVGRDILDRCRKGDPDAARNIVAQAIVYARVSHRANRQFYREVIL